MDTRQNLGFAGPVPAHTVASLTVTGTGGLPGSGVGAVVLNVTVTQPQQAGFLTVYPDGTSRPLSSSLNFVAGQTVPNEVLAPVGADGAVDFYNGSTGSVQVVVDVFGWFTAGSAAGAGDLTTVNPSRVMDTRVNQGASGPVPAGGTISLQVTGAGGLPASGVGAVVLNVTATQPEQAGYLTVYPDGASRPLASNVNFVAGQTVPNAVIAPVGSDGSVDFYNGSGGSVQVVADVFGWFVSGSPVGAGALTTVDPTRLMDTRGDQGASGPVPPGGTISLQVTGAGGLPASGVGAVVLNVTATQPQQAGYLTVYPDGENLPATSSLNFVAGQTVPNAVIAPVGGDGMVDFYNGSAGTVQIVADASGWFSPPEARPSVFVPSSAGFYDAVVSPDSTTAYLTAPSQNEVAVLDLRTATFSQWIPVGSAPTGIDITPDGTTLYVCDSGGQTISKVALSNDTVSTIITPNTFEAATPFSIGVMNNGNALFSTTFNGSGYGGNIYDLNLGTNAISLVSNMSPVTEATVLARSGDYSTVSAVLGDDSGGPIRTYFASSGTVVSSGLSEFIHVGALNGNGSTLLVDGAYVVDTASGALLGTVQNGGGFGVLDASGSLGYVVQNSNVVQVDTSRFATGPSLALPPSAGTGGPIAMTPDGSSLVVLTQNGVAILGTWQPA